MMAIAVLLLWGCHCVQVHLFKANLAGTFQAIAYIRGADDVFAGPDTATAGGDSD